MEITTECTIDDNGNMHLELPELLRKRLEGREVPIVINIPDDVIIQGENPNT